MLAGSLTMQLAYFRGPSWATEISAGETDSTVRLMKLLSRLWNDRPDPRAPLLQVGIVLGKFSHVGNHTPPLFQTVADAMEDDPDKHRRLDETIDMLRARYGRKVVYFGNMQDSREEAPMRISFTHIPDIGLEGD